MPDPRKTLARYVPDAFDRYDTRVRNILTDLALVKPPKGSDEKLVRRYLKERLKEFGII